jgi:hypothetical protein
MRGARTTAAIVLTLVVVSSGLLWSAPRTTAPSSIELNGPSISTAADGAIWPTLGDWVSFSVTYPKQAEHFGPRIQVLCYQNEQIVYGEAGPYYQDFQLGAASSDWLRNGGTAECVADLYYWSYNGGQKFNFLATTSFTAGGSNTN